MRVKIFENINELDLYLQSKKRREVEIVWKSWVRKEKGDKYEVVDRFLIIEK